MRLLQVLERNVFPIVPPMSAAQYLAQRSSNMMNKPSKASFIDLKDMVEENRYQLVLKPPYHGNLKLINFLVDVGKEKLTDIYNNQ